MKNFYDILGIEKTSDENVIKKAYYKMAKKHHPDKNDAHDSNEKFKEIGEAYETLKDADSRDLYDREYALFKRQKDGPPKYTFTTTFTSNFRFNSPTRSKGTYESFTRRDPNDSDYDNYPKAGKENKRKSRSRQQRPYFRSYTTGRFGDVPLFSYTCGDFNADAGFRSFFDDPFFSSFFDNMSHGFNDFREHKPSRKRRQKHKYNQYGYDEDLKDEKFDWTPKTPGGMYEDQYPGYVSSASDDDGSQRCFYCDRFFQPDDLRKHEPACGREQARRKKRGGLPNEDGPAFRTGERGTDWRSEHEDLLRDVNNAKRRAQDSKWNRPSTYQKRTGAYAQQNQEPEEETTYTYGDTEFVQCPSCERTFTSNAAGSHIPYCTRRTSYGQRIHDPPKYKRSDSWGDTSNRRSAPGSRETTPGPRRGSSARNRSQSREPEEHSQRRQDSQEKAESPPPHGDSYRKRRENRRRHTTAFYGTTHNDSEDGKAEEPQEKQDKQDKPRRRRFIYRQNKDESPAKESQEDSDKPRRGRGRHSSRNESPTKEGSPDRQRRDSERQHRRHARAGKSGSPPGEENMNADAEGRSSRRRAQREQNKGGSSTDSRDDRRGARRRHKQQRHEKTEKSAEDVHAQNEETQNEQKAQEHPTPSEDTHAQNNEKQNGPNTQEHPEPSQNDNAPDGEHTASKMEDANEVPPSDIHHEVNSEEDIPIAAKRESLREKRRRARAKAKKEKAEKKQRAHSKESVKSEDSTSTNATTSTSMNTDDLIGSTEHIEKDEDVETPVTEETPVQEPPRQQDAHNQDAEDNVFTEDKHEMEDKKESDNIKPNNAPEPPPRADRTYWVEPDKDEEEKPVPPPRQSRRYWVESDRESDDEDVKEFKEAARKRESLWRERLRKEMEEEAAEEARRKAEQEEAERIAREASTKYYESSSDDDVKFRRRSRERAPSPDTIRIQEYLKKRRKERALSSDLEDEVIRTKRDIERNRQYRQRPKSPSPKPEPRAYQRRRQSNRTPSPKPEPAPRRHASKPEARTEAPKPQPRTRAPKNEPKAHDPEPEPELNAPKPEPRTRRASGPRLERTNSGTRTEQNTSETKSPRDDRGASPESRRTRKDSGASERSPRTEETRKTRRKRQDSANIDSSSKENPTINEPTKNNLEEPSRAITPVSDYDELPSQIKLPAKYEVPSYKPYMGHYVSRSPYTYTPVRSYTRPEATYSSSYSTRAPSPPKWQNSSAYVAPSSSYSSGYGRPDSSPTRSPYSYTSPYSSEYSPQYSSSYSSRYGPRLDVRSTPLY